MSPRDEQPDPSEVSAEEFARLVAAWDDDGLITEGIRAVGVEPMLERVFDEMAQRFRSDRAEGVEADIQWLIEAREERHEYVVRIGAGWCEAERGRVEEPRVTFDLDIAAFARLITGQADPIRLLLTRRLRVKGDLLFARRVPTFFAMPRA